MCARGRGDVFSPSPTPAAVCTFVLPGPTPSFPQGVGIEGTGRASGMGCTPFLMHTPANTTLASVYRPRETSHRGDSGRYTYEKHVVKTTGTQASTERTRLGELDGEVDILRVEVDARGF